MHACLELESSIGDEHNHTHFVTRADEVEESLDLGQSLFHPDVMKARAEFLCRSESSSSWIILIVAKFV